MPSCLVAGPGSSALSWFGGGRCPNWSPQLLSSREDEKPRFKHEWLQSPGEELKPQTGRDVVVMGFLLFQASHRALIKQVSCMCWQSWKSHSHVPDSENVYSPPSTHTQLYDTAKSAYIGIYI